MSRLITEQTNDIKSEMNVVPLIDVMLVLLIVFMIASPMVTSSLDISLPSTGTTEQATEQNAPSTVIVSLNQEGGMFISNTEQGIMDEPHDAKSLVLSITTLFQKQPDSKIYLRADKNVQYERIVHALELIKMSGFDNVNLVTEARG